MDGWLSELKERKLKRKALRNKCRLSECPYLSENEKWDKTKSFKETGLRYECKENERRSNNQRYLQRFCRIKDKGN